MNDTKDTHDTNDTNAEAVTSFLLAEHARLQDSFVRNEEMGERRVQFFTGLVTAVAAGVFFLWSADKGVFSTSPELVWRVAALGAVFLLVVGSLTYDRLLKRDAVREEYKDELDAIRKCFIQPFRVGATVPSLANYSPFPERTAHERKSGETNRRLYDIGRLALLVAVLNSMIGAAVVLLGYRTWRAWPDAHDGELVLLVLLAIAALYFVATAHRVWFSARYERASTDQKAGSPAPQIPSV